MRFVKQEIPYVMELIRKYGEKSKNNQALLCVQNILTNYMEYPWAVSPIVVYVRKDGGLPWTCLGKKVIIFNNKYSLPKSIDLYPDTIDISEKEVLYLREFEKKQCRLLAAYHENNNAGKVRYTTGVLDFLHALNDAIASNKRNGVVWGEVET